MTQIGILVAILGLSRFSARAAPDRCSHTTEVHETTSPTSQQGCLLAQRTQMAVVESLGETSDASFGSRHAVTHRLGNKASMTVDSQASLSSRSAQWLAYQNSLPEVLAQLESSRLSVNGELEDLIDKFIDKQAGSADACHAKLVEAKHQLNQLHQHVHDLASEINATDHEVTALNNQVESKLKEYQELNKKCEDELQDLEEKQRQDLEMLNTLRNEMEEMKQIANPNVSMNIAQGTVIGGLAQLGLREFLREPHLLKAASASLMQIGAEEIKGKRAMGARYEAAVQVKNEPQNLFAPLQMAMVDVQKCLHMPAKNHIFVSLKQDPNATTTAAPVASTTFPMTTKNVECGAADKIKVNVGGVEKEVNPKRDLADGDKTTVECSEVNPDYTGAIWLTCDSGSIVADGKCIFSASNATKCEEEKATLVKVYIKVYVDLARLIHSKETDTTDGYNAAKNAIETQCDDQRKPLQDETARISNEASEKIKELEELRPKLEDAKEAENKLREQVKKLSDECALIPNATSDLNKVRDAIKALSLCPGLTRANLKVPKFIGYIDFNEDATLNNDIQIDRRMRGACQSTYRDNYTGELVLAATVAELAQASIHEMPLTNTAAKPLLGSCPDCEGDTDVTGGTQHRSGHARVCWDAGAELKLATQRTNCGIPPFSVACVVITEP